MIKIYYANVADFEKKCIVSDNEIFSCMVEKVNKQRRNKILRCKNEKDKLRSLIAGLLLRFALEQEGIDYEKSEFIYGEHGKPMLLHYKYMEEAMDIRKSSKKVFFSLTHSQDGVACAISDENIGIDLEQTNRTLFSKDRQEQLLSMVKRICTQRECVYFSNLPKEKRIKAYVELWTRKESFAKADGRGMAIGFGKVEVLDDGLFSCKTSCELTDMKEKVKKAEGIGSFFTCWISEDTCMSIYSSSKGEHIADYVYVNAEQIIRRREISNV